MCKEQGSGRVVNFSDEGCAREAFDVKIIIMSTVVIT